MQNDPRKYLNLSSHICREVEVSFSVVNKFGSTNFSESTRLDIRGGNNLYLNINKYSEVIEVSLNVSKYCIAGVQWPLCVKRYIFVQLYEELMVGCPHNL